MFHSLKTMFRSAPKAARPAKRTCLRLECLEDRATPSSFGDHVFVSGYGNYVKVDGSHDKVVVIANHSSVVIEGSHDTVIIVP